MISQAILKFHKSFFNKNENFHKQSFLFLVTFSIVENSTFMKKNTVGCKFSTFL